MIPCDKTTNLGSFWPNSKMSFESHVVKSFKECRPISDYEPFISDLCSFYADLIVKECDGIKFDFIVRVLGSSETAYDITRPQSLLVEKICNLTGAKSITDCFFKSSARPPMRTIPRLSGPDALRGRIQYIVQDLFIRPFELTGNVLLIDDIANTGASMRVYAKALKLYMPIHNVYAVNLAATRFNRGKDGLGMLELSKIPVDSYTELNTAYLDTTGVYHLNANCPEAAGKLIPRFYFMCKRDAKPCPVCSSVKASNRKWWQFWVK